MRRPRRPASRLRLLLPAWLAVMGAAVGCGKDDLPPIPPATTSILYEPPAFCVGGSDTLKTLTLYNLGDEPLVWTPERLPAGVFGFDPVVVDPVSTRDVVWWWNPSGPYPVLDSLVVMTNDPDREQVILPIRREDPAGGPDLVPPPAPLLFVPEDGAEFSVGDTITLAWSRLDDCSGIRHYRLEISLTSDFSNVVCCRDTIPAASGQVIVDPGDEGTAYWRVYALDGANLRGLASEARSWQVR